MKRYTFVIAITILCALSIASGQSYFPSYSSYQKSDIELAAKRYLISLDSPNEGIVNSALAQIGRIKLYFQERKFNEIEKKVNELALTGQTSSIRYRAFLISNLFTSPALFASETPAQYQDSEALFNDLAERLHATVLGSNQAQ